MKKINYFIYALIGVFFLAVLFLLFSWGYSSIEEMSSQSLQAEFQELKRKEKDFFKLEKSVKEWEKIDQFYALFKKEHLMKFDQFPDFRNKLEKIVKKNFLDSSRLNFKINYLKDNIVRVSISFGLKGTYKNIKKFIFDIEHVPQLIFLNETKLSKVKGLVSGKFSMEVYFVR
jgi:Tfp pilus assembly protein PilO